MHIIINHVSPPFQHTIPTRTSAWNSVKHTVMRSSEILQNTLPCSFKLMGSLVDGCFHVLLRLYPWHNLHNGLWHITCKYIKTKWISASWMDLNREPVYAVTPHSNISEQSHSRILETRTFVTQLAISAKDLQRSQRWNKTKAFRPPMTSAKAPNCLKPILKLEPWHIMASCDLCTAFNGHTSAAKMLCYKISYQSRTIWHCKDRFGSHVLRGNRWATTKATIPSH